ncbi:hypothetical protein [Pseudoalteromonas spongiae]|uniref:hypothetical protein n=1 Tax=Pseudoalteromonas spongiae TaxID=298657 RepID=UPI000C2D4932|nr:hypothetical protein [Pseudoalteromonas spongiae]
METQLSSKDAANQVLDKWEISQEVRDAILPTDESSKNNACRYTLINKIDTSLQRCFNNADNVNQFMLMKNYNPFFNGRRPIDIISNGELKALYEVTKHIRAMEYR